MDPLRTSVFDPFKILSESALGSGVRRIEAVAGKAALEVFQNYNNLISDISTEMRVSSENLKYRVSSLISDKKTLEKQHNLDDVSILAKKCSRLSQIPLFLKVLEFSAGLDVLYDKCLLLII